MFCRVLHCVTVLCSLQPSHTHAMREFPVQHPPHQTPPSTHTNTRTCTYCWRAAWQRAQAREGRACCATSAPAAPRGKGWPQSRALQYSQYHLPVAGKILGRPTPRQYRGWPLGLMCSLRRHTGGGEHIFLGQGKVNDLEGVSLCVYVNVCSNVCLYRCIVQMCCIYKYVYI